MTSITATTTTLTTPIPTTTTRWPFPSLFCIAVVRTLGTEPALIKAQYFHQIGIFGCDEYQVYSNGGVLQVGNMFTQEIPAPTVSMGDMSVAGTTTSSWLNTMVFMKMWDLVTADGRWWNHDWSVKVDPDAVFFPERLRTQLLPHTMSLDGPALYVGNCDRHWHNGPIELKLFGSLEVFSRNAIGAYKAFNGRCQRDLKWKGWGEDFFMQNCMNLLGVGVINGTTYLGDKRCRFAPCSDPTKVAFHDFKTVAAYFDCWGQSRSNEPMEIFMKKK